MSSATLKEMQRAIIIEMQCHDFGHVDDDGDFHTTPPKIALLESCALAAAERIIICDIRPAGDVSDLVRSATNLIQSLKRIGFESSLIDDVQAGLSKAQSPTPSNETRHGGV